MAREVLAGERGLIEGSIALAGYAHHMVPDWRLDSDWRIFEALASETDDLPFGEVRSRWSVASLVENERLKMHLRVESGGRRLNAWASDERRLAAHRHRPGSAHSSPPFVTDSRARGMRRQ